MSPEGLSFVSSNDAGKPLILAACEVSGTLPVYELSFNDANNDTDNGNTDNNNTGNDSQIKEPVLHKHSPVVSKKKAATYFAAGYTGDTYCKDCGVLISKGKSIARKKLKKPIIKVKAKKKKLIRK